MDFISHALLGITLSNFVNSTEEKLIIIVSSITPDLGEIFIQKELSNKFGERIAVYDERTSDIKIAENLNITWLYDLFHSPIFYVFVLGLNLILGNKLIYDFCFAGLGHLLFDFTTHGKVWALKLLFPLSNTRFPILANHLGNWWEWEPQFTLPLTSISLPRLCLLVWLLLSFLFIATF